MEDVIIRCNHCGKKNKLKKSDLEKTIKCGHCHEPMKIIDEARYITEASYNAEVVNNPGVTLLEMYTDSCGYCKQLNPVLDEIAKEYKGVIKVVKVNAEQERKLAMGFMLRGVPTLILFNDGRQLDMKAGAMSKEQIIAWMRNYIIL